MYRLFATHWFVCLFVYSFVCFLRHRSLSNQIGVVGKSPVSLLRLQFHV